MRRARLTTLTIVVLTIFVVTLTACASERTSGIGQTVTPVPPGQGVPPSLPPANAPVWRLGSEWSFQYETPTSKGTFVDVVSREETVDGIDYYVIASEGLEYLYRKTDFAYYIQRDSSGRIRRRHVPPHTFWAWPLTVGKQWQETLTIEYPLTRQTEQLRVAMRVETTETVTVPAGTFDTFKIVRRNNRSGVVDGEFWYSPEVRYFVRFRLGNYQRELTKFLVQP